MASGISRILKSPVFRIVVAQFIATLLALASSLFFGQVAVVSALLAGVVCIVPGLFVLAVSMRPVAPGTTGLSQVIKGEIGKLGLTVLLFAVVFIWMKPLDVMVFFTTVAILQLCNAVIPLMDARRLLRS